MAEPAKRLTIEELRAKTAKAIKEATTFEKSPTYDMPVGTEILFKVKKVAEGTFGAPIVVCSEIRVMDGTGKFVATALRAYMQDGLTGPRTYMEVKPGEEIRAPTFVAKRAVEKKLEFHPNQVYWSKYIEEKKLQGGKTFKVCAVDLVGTEFPDA